METDFTAGGTLSRFAGCADVGNLVAPDDDTRLRLLAQATGWLRLGGVERLVAYADEGEDVSRYERARVESAVT